MISRDNPLWGAPRIHGELLKLGIDIAQSTVAKYMLRRRRPPSPGGECQCSCRLNSVMILPIEDAVVLAA